MLSRLRLLFLDWIRSMSPGHGLLLEIPASAELHTEGNEEPPLLPTSPGFIAHWPDRAADTGFEAD